VFTGLVQGLGKIKTLDAESFWVIPRLADRDVIFDDLTVGDSVAVDGVCLTVESLQGGGFQATASPETLRRTSLIQQIEGDRWVNLETSLRMGGKLGGHFVTGHVDGVGYLWEAIATDRSWEITFGVGSSDKGQWEQAIAPYLVAKGSVAVNGISLTLANCDPQGEWFKAAVIPHTYAETNLCYLQAGDLVNLECDILGKYVDRLLAHRLGHSPVSQAIGLDFLVEHGYL
jgi:riboflavin synthase